MLKTILVDFDGVLHSYASGWLGADVIPDPPVPGAIEWLRALVVDEGLQVAIFSSRSNTTEGSRGRPGIAAMKRWLLSHGLETRYLDVIEFPREKSPAHLTIDDRAICFEGTYPSAEEILAFVPWNKR